MKGLIVGIVLSGLSFNALAIGGADVLLNSVSTEESVESADTVKNSPTPDSTVFEGFKLNDPFTVQMFTEWRTAGKIDYEINAWFLKLLQGKYEESAHLLTVMSEKMPTNLYDHLRVSEAYLYHKLGLQQRFFDTWVELLSDKKVIESRIGMTLWQYVDQHSKNFFEKNGIVINREQEKTIKEVENANTPFFIYAKAAISLRNGKEAYQSMVSLPSGHPFRIPLTQTVVLEMARNDELGSAGKIIKKYLEPEIEKLNDPYLLGEYYVNLARFLYQAGAMDAAETYYLKVPDKHPQFTQARAELMWTYLRTNQTAKLRGQLASLKSELFNDYFIPEIYVVRSISNLKLCQYGELEKDFNSFISSNKKWAGVIRSKIKEENPKWSEHKDFFLKLADQRVSAIKLEIAKIEKLAKRSIKAALPAVGIQPHWSKNIAYLNEHLVQAEKKRLVEYKRPWLNRERILSEAIKKMKFVKVEAMSQLRELDRSGQKPGKGIKASEPLAQNIVNDKLVFPYDGVFWPDEVLNLRAKAKSFCLEKAAL